MKSLKSLVMKKALSMKTICKRSLSIALKHSWKHSKRIVKREEIKEAYHIVSRINSLVRTLEIDRYRKPSHFTNSENKTISNRQARINKIRFCL